MISSSDILKASILIVDDQEANVSLLEQMLRGAGYVSIASTRDPHEVCELHREHRYDLILLDVQMPHMDGFQVMEGLKEIETGGYLPVLVITSQPGHKLRALKAGAKDFVSKPLDLAEVLIRVYNMLEVRLLHLETKRLYDQLQSANEELESFAYSVSHDLHAPLRAIDAFSQAVLEDYGPQLPEEGQRYLQTIRDRAQQMGKLIDDLLAFSRLSRQPLSKQTVDVAKLVRDVIEELGPQRDGRQVEIRVGDLPSCESDPSLLKQVWINLLSNALKYSRQRKLAVIEVGAIGPLPSADAPDSPREGTRPTNNEVTFFIRDNGTGFDMQYASKVFGVFQRLHRAEEYEGTGVGLAIVQRVVDRHGGRVWAEAAVDRGATFYFTLDGGTNHVLGASRQVTELRPLGTDS